MTANPGDKPDDSGGSSGSRAFRAFSAVLLVACIPLVVLALAAMTGVGLQQNIPGQLALLGAIAVVILPALGLAAALGGRAIAYAISLAAVSYVVVASLPHYFPGQRDASVRAGASYFGRSFGEAGERGAVNLTTALLRVFGTERAPTLRAERAGDDARDPIETAEVGGDEDAPAANATWIPYEADGESIVIPAHVDGPDFGEELRFVFDTGATLTTISADVLDLLDVRIPEDAPEVTLRTAAGEMQARLVLVDAIWLQREVVEWVTVAVCEHCASGVADGLLGLNVSSHYRVSIDHEAGELEWVPRRGRRNRRLDIQPWLDMNSVLRRWDDGRMELEVRVGNRARRAIRRSVLEVSCSNEKFTVHLDPIPAKGAVTQTASLPWGVRCEAFEVVPVAAAWETDRF